MNSQQADQGRIIARRDLKSDDGDVVVTISEPTLRAAEDWHCEFAIVGAGHDIRHACSGSDSLDALITAINGIRAHLEPIAHLLTWDDGPPGDLGVPRPIPSSYGVVVEKQLIDLLNNEVARITAAKWSG